MTNPESPDTINDILATPRAETSMDERTEGELRGAIHALANGIGREAFIHEMGKWLVQWEPTLRATQPADHPALVALDRYRATTTEEERGFA